MSLVFENLGVSSTFRVHVGFLVCYCPIQFPQLHWHKLVSQLGHSAYIIGNRRHIDFFFLSLKNFCERQWYIELIGIYISKKQFLDLWGITVRGGMPSQRMLSALVWALISLISVSVLRECLRNCICWFPVSFSKKFSAEDPNFWRRFPFGGDNCFATTIVSLISVMQVFPVVLVIGSIQNLTNLEVSMDTIGRCFQTASGIDRNVLSFDFFRFVRCSSEANTWKIQFEPCIAAWTFSVVLFFAPCWWRWFCPASFLDRGSVCYIGTKIAFLHGVVCLSTYLTVWSNSYWPSVIHGKSELWWNGASPVSRCIIFTDFSLFFFSFKWRKLLLLRPGFLQGWNVGFVFGLKLVNCWLFVLACQWELQYHSTLVLLFFRDVWQSVHMCPFAAEL